LKISNIHPVRFF